MQIEREMEIQDEEMSGQVSDRAVQIRQLEQKVWSVSSACAVLAGERETLQAEREECLVKQAQLALAHTDAQTVSEQNAAQKVILKTQLERFDAAIQERQDKISQLEPRLVELRERERTLDAQFVLFNQIKKVSFELSYRECQTTPQV